MEVKLIVVGGKHPGQKVPVPGPKYFIGRAEDCHLRPSSDLVSRHHAVIIVEEAFVGIRDFGSKNGTFVNGERILAERELKTGDRLKVGPLEFEVELSVPVGGRKKAKVQTVEEAAERTAQASADERTAQASADDDLDISDWLGEDEKATQTTRAFDMESLETPATDGSIKDTTTIPGETVVPQRSSDQQGKKKKQPGKAGRLADSKGPTATDSRAAADDMLRKFFGRKA